MTHIEYTNFELVNIDLAKIHEGSVIYVCGPKSCGKSTLIRDIIQTNNWEEVTTVFATYLNSNLFCNRSLQEQRTFTEMSDEKIEELCSNNNHGVVVLDSGFMFGQSKVFVDNIIDRLIDNPKITLIMSVQFPMCLTLEFHQKIDYIFIFDQTMSSNIKRVYMNYFSELLSYESFDELFKEATVDHGVLAIDGNNEIYSYRARQYPTYESKKSGLSSYCLVM